MVRGYISFHCQWTSFLSLNVYYSRLRHSLQQKLGFYKQYYLNQDYFCFFCIWSKIGEWGGGGEQQKLKCQAGDYSISPWKGCQMLPSHKISVLFFLYHCLQFIYVMAEIQVTSVKAGPRGRGWSERLQVHQEAIQIKLNHSILK